MLYFHNGKVGLGKGWIPTLMGTQNSGCLSAILQIFKPKKKQPKYTVTVVPPEEVEELPYHIRDDFLSPAETSFFQVLKTMMGDHFLICPKVSLGDIFYVSRPHENAGYRNKIDRKHVDFLLCNPKTLQPVFAIELDDASHRRPDRVERDAFVDEVFETAVLPLVRVPAQMSYNTQELGSVFKRALQGKLKVTPPDAEKLAAPDTQPPVCPKCRETMILRTATRGKNAGQKFYGCPNYPKCRQVIPIA